eukprot:s1726_g24.t1
MEKQVHAVQKFLKGLASLSTFAGIKAKQFQHLRGVIQKAASQSTSAIADIVASLDPAIWNQEELETLKQDLAEKTGEPRERRAMQDYTAFPRYMPERLWNAMLTTTNQLDRLELLTRHCIGLGMRCPSEPTIGGLVWMSTCALRTQEISESEKRLALKDSKPNIRRWLQNLAAPAVYLQMLPTNVNDCPAALMQHAFPQGFQAYSPPGFQMTHYEEVVRRFPLRRRAGEEATAASVGQGDDYKKLFGTLLAGVVEGALSRSASGSSAGASSRGEQPSSVMPVMDLAQVSRSQPAVAASHAVPAQLALEDVKPEGAAAPVTRGVTNMELELQGLRDALNEPDADLDRSLATCKKRPAANNGNAKKAALKKKPAASAGSAGSMKRPAACDGTRASSIGSAGSKKGLAACEAADKAKCKVALAAGSAGSKKRPAAREAAGARMPALSRGSAGSKELRASKAAGKAVTKAKKALGKKEYRQRLLSIIPAAEKKRFAKGCTSCRYRPLCCNSCWIKRGYRV